MKIKLFRTRSFVVFLCVLLLILNIVLLVFRFIDWNLDWYYGDFRTILFNISENGVDNYSVSVSTLKKIHDSIILDFTVEFVFLFVILCLFIVTCRKKKADSKSDEGNVASQKFSK